MSTAAPSSPLGKLPHRGPPRRRGTAGPGLPFANAPSRLAPAARPRATRAREDAGRRIVPHLLGRPAEPTCNVGVSVGAPLRASPPSKAMRRPREKPVGQRHRLVQRAIVVEEHRASSIAHSPLLFPQGARRLRPRSRAAGSPSRWPTWRNRSPCFPPCVPALSMACSMVSVVTMPNITGTSDASATCAMPLATSLQTKS